MTDRYTKLIKAILTIKPSATTVARVFFEHWLANDGILCTLPTNYGPQSMSRCFVAVCSTLGVNNITTTVDHPPSNGQAKRFSSALISRLHHYMSEHHTDFDNYSLALS